MGPVYISPARTLRSRIPGFKNTISVLLEFRNSGIPWGLWTLMTLRKGGCRYLARLLGETLGKTWRGMSGHDKTCQDLADLGQTLDKTCQEVKKTWQEYTTSHYKSGQNLERLHGEELERPDKT